MLMETYLCVHTTIALWTMGRSVVIIIEQFKQWKGKLHNNLYSSRFHLLFIIYQYFVTPNQLRRAIISSAIWLVESEKILLFVSFRLVNLLSFPFVSSMKWFCR